MRANGLVSAVIYLYFELAVFRAKSAWESILQELVQQLSW